MGGQQDFAVPDDRSASEAQAISAATTAAFLDSAYGGIPKEKVVLAAFQSEKAQNKPAEVLRAEDVAKLNSVERIKLLADDAKKGAWGDNAQVIWSQIFKEARQNMPGASIDNLLDELRVRTVREINKQLMKDENKHLITLGRANETDKDESILGTSYYAQINGGKIDTEDNIKAIRGKLEKTASSVKIGHIDWDTEKKVFEKAKTDLIQTIEQDAFLRNDWSILGKDACKKLFDLVSTKPGGTTIKDTVADLKAISKEITASLAAKGSKKFVDLAGAAVLRPSDFEFYMLLSKDKAQQQSTLQAIQAGQSRDTYVPMGSMYIRSNGDALKKDDFDRGARLAEESATGSWSSRTQETWRRVFNDANEKTGMNPQPMKAELIRYADKINEFLGVKNSNNDVKVETNLNSKTGEIDFFLQLNIQQGNTPINRDANKRAITEGRDTGTSVKVGSMRIKDIPAPKRKGNDA